MVSFCLNLADSCIDIAFCYFEKEAPAAVSFEKVVFSIVPPLLLVLLQLLFVYIYFIPSSRFFKHLVTLLIKFIF
jgi:hypothetical protein